jgi:hypothetical protein
METDLLEATLIPAEDSAEFCTTMAGLFVSALDGLGPRLGGELLALDTVVALEDRVDIEAAAIRSEICRQLDAFVERLPESAGNRQPAKKASRRRVGGRRPNTIARKQQM